MFFYSWQPHQLQACALIADCKREVGTNFEDQAPLMYRSNRSFNIHHPGIWLFWKLLFKFPPTRAQNAVQMPHTRVHSGDQMPPSWGHFTGTKMTEGRRKRLQLSNKIFINITKTLLAYLLRTKNSCKAAEIVATRSLNAQLFFIMQHPKGSIKKDPTHWDYYIMTISLTCIIAHRIN